jgi:hypothetical protein
VVGRRRSLTSRFACAQRHGTRRGRDEGAAARWQFRAARIEQGEQSRRAIEPRRTFRIRRVERRPWSATFLGQLL